MDVIRMRGIKNGIGVQHFSAIEPNGNGSSQSLELSRTKVFHQRMLGGRIKRTEVEIQHVGLVGSESDGLSDHGGVAGMEKAKLESLLFEMFHEQNVPTVAR